MLRRFAQLLQLKPGEGRITLLMFTYIFGVLSFYYILKPMRSAFFLKKLPSTDLPYAYILTAIFAGTITTLLFKYSKRLSVIALVTSTNLTIIGTLFLFRWAMGRDIVFLPYAWFVYLQIVPVLCVAQFWLLAGYVYDNRQAKRVYGLLGAGAIAGASAGSYIPAFLSRVTTDMRLLLCIGICCVLIVLAHIAWRQRRLEADQASHENRFEESRERVSDLLRMVFGSKHLLLMSFLVCLSLVASQIVDWQVNNALDVGFRNLSPEQREVQINMFWGQLYFWTNTLGIALQLIVTHLVVSRLGIGAAILFLPIGVFSASFGVLLAPALWSTTLALGTNNVFRYSINRAGLELLYMPLSRAARKKLKLFIDVFVDRFGRAIAALLILAFAGLKGTSISVMVLTLASIIVCLQVRKAYVNAFRQQLARREVDLAEVSRYVTEPATVQLLIETLKSSQERQILYALRLLQSVRGGNFASDLLPLLEHPSPHIREAALQTLSSLAEDHRQEVERLLHDPSAPVRSAAVEYLCSCDPSRAIEALDALLNHDEIDIRLSAVVYATAQTDFEPSRELVDNLLAVQGSRAVSARAAAARLCARLSARESIPMLKDFLRDSEPEVVAAAAWAAGHGGFLELVFPVLTILPHRSSRNAGREALVELGTRILGTLGDALGDPGQSLEIRREIPWILGRLPVRRSAEILADNLDARDPLLKYRIVKALNHLHEMRPEFPSSTRSMVERIHLETRAYYEVFALYRSIPESSDAGRETLLCRAIRERLDQNLEIIFRLLGLKYPQKDIYSVYTALKGNRSDRRASAIEFLDNLLQKNLKSVILPLLEESSADRLMEYGSRLFGINTRNHEEALRLILKQPDVWLKACALHEIGARCLKNLSDLCRALAKDENPLVRETAQWAHRHCLEGTIKC